MNEARDAAARRVELIVNGTRYSGWKSIRVTRSAEAIAGSFALDVSDRWGQERWPIVEGDACRVEIAGVTVIDGFIGKRRISASATSRGLSYVGRDRSGILVDCDPILNKWTYRNVDVQAFATALCANVGVSVSVQDGLKLTSIPKLVIQPGDTYYEALKRAVADQGVMLISDAAGGITITRSGTDHATPLVEGRNILTADVEYDGDDRFYRYVVATQTAGTDEASANATRVSAEAIDEGVGQFERTKLIRPEKGLTVAGARARADWEARVRAARAEAVTITVQGWEQPNGKIWPVNALTLVRARESISIEGVRLITQVEHSIGEDGELTQLRLVRPDAFTPEPGKPLKPAKSAGSNIWLTAKDLRR